MGGSSATKTTDWAIEALRGLASGDARPDDVQQVTGTMPVRTIPDVEGGRG
jgi:hypothetical protein